MGINRQKLHIISSSLPYDAGEQFYVNELKFLAKYFDEIVVYPQKKTSENIRRLPDNVKVSNCLLGIKNKPKGLNVKKMFLFMSIMFQDMAFNKSILPVLKKFRYNRSSFLQCYQKSELYIDHIPNDGATNLHYSLWMDDGAMILALLKKKKKIKDYYFRVNGFDMFESRRIDGYIPFKKFIFKKASKAFVLSTQARSYLADQDINLNKLILAHHAIPFGQLGPIPHLDDVFTIVSCSNVVEIKRLDRIVEALSKINFKCHWVHFGDGPLFEKMNNSLKNIENNNLSFKFFGATDNKEIMAFYASIKVNLFLHTSESEGLGVALIEATSFGIPVLAYDVGGVGDIVVEDKTGWLLSKETTSPELRDAIKIIKQNGVTCSEEFRNNVYKKSKENFDATKNYKQLAYKLKEV